ncbi:MAG TPA: cysteine-rich CWC family protein [Polyangiales bacterium]|nr:cysteine-rich CWC family protein [Polyangiales bacterium]
MTEPSKSNETGRCPLCGEPNECAIVAGRDPESCWCMSATMSPRALAAIPDELQGKVCICARCASGASAVD